MAAFLIIESRRDNAMLDLSLFRVPAFGGVSIVAWALSAGMFAMFLYITLYVQDVLDFSPLEAGLRFLPITLLSFFVAPIGGQLLKRWPARMLLGVGLILVGIGLLLMHGIEVGDSWTHLLPGFLVAGIGIGLTNPAIASTALGVVPPARAGMASGINSTFRQVGHRDRRRRPGRGVPVPDRERAGHERSRRRRPASPTPSPPARPIRRWPAVPPAVRPEALDAANHAFVTAFNEILLIAAAVSIVGGILGLLMVRQRDFVSPPAGERCRRARSRLRVGRTARGRSVPGRW